MATITRRQWTYKGAIREAWVARYADSTGKWRLKTFKRQKDAAAWLRSTEHQIGEGRHTPDSDSVTIAKACDLWIQRCEVDGLERSTIRGYRQQAHTHIVPALGAIKLSRLTAPRCEEFKDDLLRRLSRPLAIKVMTSLRMVLADAMRRGLCAQNVAREIKLKRRGRDKERVAIPTKGEVKLMLATVADLWRPLLVTAVFTGLRASELRGLAWEAVDLDHAELHVVTRADRFNDMGPPKSATSRRTVMLPPIVVNVLKEWRLRCPRRDGELVLVFPNGIGRVETLHNICSRGFRPVQMACGITRQIGVDGAGKPILRARYGLHALRHFYASWLIDQKFPPKRVQALMGHSTVSMTLDTYSHLWPVSDDERERLAVSAAALVG